MIKKSAALITTFLLMQFSHQAHAHHGFAAHFYPDQIIRIEGTITRFDFINPHGYLFIETANGDEYMCDLQARTQLVRRGVDETLFTVGDSIVVEGFKARRNPLQCEFGTAYFTDGSTFTMRSTESAQTQFATIAETEEAKAGTQTIFGKWIRPGLTRDVSGTAPTTGTDSMTEAGQAALDAFDPITGNPVLRCETGSPVRTWGAPGLATRIFEEDSNVLIYHESMDVTRTIYMDKDAVPSNLPRSDMGLSVGRFEDGNLIVNSSNFKAGVLRGTILNTEDMTLEERLSINEEGRLIISWSMNDPEYYSDPIESSQILRSTSREIIPYECVPESHQ